MSKKNIKTVSLDDLDSMEDRSRRDAPDGESLGPDFWKSAKIVYPEGSKERITVRFDRDVVRWFKAQGRGYQTRMNAVLRSYFEAQETGQRKP
ncbi:MAG: BrnA antitoxin family protein [Rhodospirillaceae bacterium]|jgi:uncharacterized protein (DUF4415 family)|nr:BrnA antitoxin family protein [Rhodospirillaceae bacterium]MBT5666582.1 BrnA antitoxin family protein [Rhodospirillaceae bacterium]MBT5809281.1 BrnA antitoxin family protein [Rhodospirillaceae bacterium]